MSGPKKKTWSKELLEDAFRPYLEMQRDQSPQGRKRARILRAATELFEKQGYRKTSVDEIARKAEVAKGTVYLYYDNKAKLLVDAIALQKLALWSKLEPLVTGKIPEADRLRYYVGIILTSAREVPLAARLMRGDGELAAVMEEVGDDPRFAENQARGTEWLSAMIEQAAPGVLSDEEKRRRVHALMTLGFLSGVLLDERARLGRSFDEITSTLADIVVYGAVNAPPERE
jgi:AcrR family transcriptional regulator